MSGRQILSIVLAIVVGIILWKVVSLILSGIWFILTLAVGAGLVYALYRGFNNMLSSGKRLT
jgi:hypothetical protein